MGDMIIKTNPVTGEKIGEFPISSPEHVSQAVARARGAFLLWSQMSLRTRMDALAGLQSEILRKGEEFARRISEDTGKPLVDSLLTELMSVPLFLGHYRKLAPRVLSRRKVKTPLVFQGKKSYVEHFPMGVIGVISPWNFPFQLSMIPIISALIGGNTVVLKPSEVTPITGEIVRELFAAIDVPEGTVEVIQGDGGTGAALVEADIDKVFFTGSVATGRKVMAAAAKKPIPVELELGGKDAMIICADANLKRAAKGAVWGGLLNCGQVCTSVERIFVEASVYDRFIELLKVEVEAVRVGGPDEKADVGPLTFPQQLETVEAQIEQAKSAGAKVLVGGERLDRKGQFYMPTVLTGVKPDMAVYREETFGPVLPVIKVADVDEAVRMANDHQYGLTGSVWTSDLKRGLAIASRLECGQVMVNDVITSVGNPAIPFGGVKSSGFGRYHGPEGLLAFTNQKAIMVGKDKANSEPFWFPYEKKYDEVLEAFRLLLNNHLLKALGPLKRLNKINREADVERKKGFGAGGES
ncbi:MAG: aldehyde dehydrogenase family protein [Deltaproteobacteria bacterium]|nr:aldehyde dehydrogenase family protein [Deltaproteobacteria bacterium]